MVKQNDLCAEHREIDDLEKKNQRNNVRVDVRGLGGAGWVGGSLSSPLLYSLNPLLSYRLDFLFSFFFSFFPVLKPMNLPLIRWSP